MSDRITPIKTFLNAETTRFGMFVIFLLLVFLTGGGSRSDIASLVILRPLAVIFGAYAILQLRRGDLAPYRVPFFFLIALAILLIMQLVPLPPDIWTALPGRQIFAEIAELAGITQPWRPLTLSPMRTMNSLMSLTVPIAALLLFAIQSRRHRRSTVYLLLALGFASALLGFLQIIGPREGPLYTYAITNNGDPVGFFANRNHQAVFLACLFPLIGFAIRQLDHPALTDSVKQFVALLVVLFLVPLILMTGSRAGSALAIISLIMTGIVMFLHAPAKQHKHKRKARPVFMGLSLAQLQAVGSVVAIMLVITLAILFSRAESVDRIIVAENREESRLLALPYLLVLIQQYFPFGSGFGTFDFVYKSVEPLELLDTSYLNQAHSDWIQPIIEGGIAGALLLIALVLWFIKACIQLFLTKKYAAAGDAGEGRSGKSARSSLLLARYAAITCVLVALASIIDYPVRTPIFMVFLTILTCWMAQAANSSNRSD